MKLLSSFLAGSINTLDISIYKKLSANNIKHKQKTLSTPAA